jgi:hypothetical protein
MAVVTRIPQPNVNVSAPEDESAPNLFGEIAGDVFFFPLLRAIFTGSPYDTDGDAIDAASEASLPADIAIALSGTQHILARPPKLLAPSSGSGPGMSMHRLLAQVICLVVLIETTT